MSNMNENMEAAPRDGRILVLRLADGDVVRGRFNKSVGVWTMPAGTVLIPRPYAWRACDCTGCTKIGVCNFEDKKED